MDISTREITSKNVRWKQRRFFNHRNYIEKSKWKQRGFFDQRNYTKKVRGNNVDFSVIEITSKKNTWKQRVDFSTIEIT